MMRRQKSERNNPSAFADIGVFSIHWLTETVGATHPVRFGLALAMTLTMSGAAKTFAGPPISEFTYQFFGLSFLSGRHAPFIPVLRA
jgi:hypothetical protein